MKNRMLLPQLITEKNLATIALEGKLTKMNVEYFPTSIPDIHFILFDVAIDSITNPFAEGNYLCTVDVRESWGLSKTAAFELAMHNLEDLPSVVVKPDNADVELIQRTNSLLELDSYEAVRCFVPAILNKHINTENPRYIAFPNFNYPIIFGETVPIELARVVVDTLYDDTDELHFTNQLFVVENGIIRVLLRGITNLKGQA